MAFNGECLLLLAGPLFSALELISPMSCDNQCRGHSDLCLFYVQRPSCIKSKTAGLACLHLVPVLLIAQINMRTYFDVAIFNILTKVPVND